MALFDTKYPNNSRIVTGTPQLYNDDVVLLCDTSVGAVIINLLEIPPSNWSTQWKLYIVDSGNNASVNNITINSGVGQTINIQPTLTLNTNGASAVVRIVSDTDFIASSTFTASSGVQSVTGLNTDNTDPANPIVALSVDGITITGAGTLADPLVAVQSDSGWLNLEGFDHLVGYASRPQCRLIGKQLNFRGVLIVPLATTSGGGTLVPIQLTPAIGSFYANEALPWVYQGVGGVTLVSAGGLLFNKNVSVIPAGITGTIDALYNPGLRIATRPVATSNPNSGTSLSAVVSVSITSDGKLVMATYKDLESSPNIPNPSIGFGTGGMRQVVTNVKSGQAVVDFRDAGSGNATQSNGSGVSPWTREWLTSSFTNTYLFDVDAGEQDQIGGFFFRMDGLVAFMI